MEIVSFDLAQHHLQYLQKVSNILAVPAVLQMNHFDTLDVVHRPIGIPSSFLKTECLLI